MLQRKLRGRVQFTNSDRLFFIQLYRWFPPVLKAITIIRPETLVGWHRAGFRRYWRWSSRNFGGRPQISAELRALIRRMSVENALWGTPRIHGELLKLGSPCQNGYVERLIGSIRRECMDDLLVFNAEHLRRILSKYASYYNEVRTHVSLGKDASCRRPIERFGDIVAYPILGELHHCYARI